MPEENSAQKPVDTVETQPSPTAPSSPKKAEVVPSSHPTDEENKKTDRDKPKWTDIAVAFFTVCLVGVAIWQGVIFRRQWQEMHSGGTDTHDLAVSAKAQADASRAQADEAKVQVEKLTESLKKTDVLIKEATAQAAATNALAVQAQRSADFAQQAIKTSVESERPWVGVSFAQVNNFVEGQTAKITVNFTNSGRRPASARDIHGVVVSKSLPMFPTLGTKEASIAYILPGATFSTAFEYNVPVGAFAEWKRTKQVFFIFSEIVYTDVGTNASYITHFCEYYSPDNKDQPFALCTRYNEAK